MPYTAGTIFLQVVPSYRGVQESIGRQAKEAARSFENELEREAGKGGKRAGKAHADAFAKAAADGAGDAGDAAAEKYAGRFRDTLKRTLKNTARELKPIEIEIDVDKASQERLREIEARIDALGDKQIGVDLNAEDAITELLALEAMLKEFSTHAYDLDVRVDTAAAMEKLIAMRALVERLTAKPEKIRIEVEERALGHFEQTLRARVAAAAAAIPPVPIDVDVDATAAERELDAIRIQLLTLADAHIGVDIDAAAARAKIEELERQLAILAAREPNIDVKVNAAKASAELAAFAAQVRAVDALDINVDVDKNRGLKDVESDAEGAAGSFRAFSGVVLGFLLLAPIVVPALGAIAAGLGAIIAIAGAAAAGVGVLLLAFSGIIPAVQAYNNVQKNSARDTHQAAKTIRTAGEAVQDAERSLSRARVSAAQSNVDAAHRVEDARRQEARAVTDAIDREISAEQRLADTQRAAKKAQEDLVAARIQAAQDLQDLQNRVDEGRLAERQALIDLFNATVAYRAAQADPGATNLDKEQASIQYEQAKLGIKEVRQQNARLHDEQTKARKDGINGSQAVQSAQDQLLTALRDQTQAQKDLGKAAAAVDQARADGAQAVTDALQQQSRTAVAGAQSIEDAQRSLTRAQQGYTDAVYETGALGASSMQKLHDALSKLSPAGREFAKFIFSLQGYFLKLRFAAQEGLLSGVTDGMKLILHEYGPGLLKFVGDMSKVFGDLFRAMAKAFTGPEWHAFFKMIAHYAPIFTKQFFLIAASLATAFANIAVAFAPFAKQLGDALVYLTNKFRDWTAGLKGSKDFQAFLDYVRKEAPVLLKFFLALGAAILTILVAFAPYADTILRAFTVILGAIASINPKVLGAIILGIAGLILAFQVALGIGYVAVGIAALLSGSLEANAGLIAGAVVLIGIAVLLLYHHFAWFRTGVIAIWDAIKFAIKSTIDFFVNDVVPAFGKAVGVLGEIWNYLYYYYIGPVVDLFVAAVRFLWTLVGPILKALLVGFAAMAVGLLWAWTNIIWPMLKVFGVVVGWLWTNVIGPILVVLATEFRIMALTWAWVFNNVLGPVLDAFKAAIELLWKYGVQPYLDIIGKAFAKVGEAFEWYWKHSLKPVIDLFGNAIQHLSDWISPLFDGMGSKWGELADLAKKPVEFIINTILNDGLIAGFNWIADKLGTKQIPRIELPASWTYDSKAHAPPGGTQTFGHPAFARGGVEGVRPGYTPGRDTHLIAVGGGEAIMRPEWTRAVGVDFIDRANAIARTLGAEGVRRMMGFARGGIVPDFIKRGAGAVTGAVGSALDLLNPWDWLRHRVAGLFGHTGDTWFGNFALDIPRKALDAVVDKLKGIVGLGGGGGGGDIGAVNIPKTAVAKIVQTVATTFGWGTGAMWKALGWIISHESGWNPNAQNPTSTAYGLFQFLNSTWGGTGIAKTSDPTQQSIAGMRYIGSRYENPVKAQAFWQSHGWYNQGGIVPRLYDNGGALPPGLTLALNATGRTEHIHTTEQLRQLVGASAGGGIAVTVPMMPTNSTPADVAASVLFAARQIRQGGVYAGGSIHDD